MLFRKSTPFVLLSLASAYALGVTGCGTSSTVPTIIPTGVRCFNGLICPTSPKMTVNFTAGSTVINPISLSYAQSTLYISSVPFGASISESVVNTASPTPPIATASNPIFSGTAYTLAAAGDCRYSGSDPRTPALVQSTDFFPTSTSLGANTAAIRVVNLVVAASDSPYKAFSVYNGNSPIAGLTNIPYKSTTAYTNIATNVAISLIFQNSVNTTVTLTDTTEQNIVANLQNFLAAGHSFTIFLVGEPDDTTANAPFDVRILQDD